jgi:DNA-damage-inducible protein J
MRMATQTSMLHVRVDHKLKAAAAKKLANFGLTVSDAVRILLTRVAKEGALPAGLTADPEAYDAWFRAKVQEGAGEQASCGFPPAGHARRTSVDRQETLCPHLNGGKLPVPICSQSLIISLTTIRRPPSN